jgi:hypothetical protein
MMIEEAVRQTRNLWRSSALIWGHSDCMISCADYAQLVTGSDPAAIWRGCYTTREGALEIIAAAGGVSRLMGLGLASIGARPIAAPGRGDLVCAAVHGEEIGGLCLGDVVAFRRPSGAIELPARFLKFSGAWGLE